MLRWERSGGVDGIEPVPPEIDLEMFAMQVGKVLGIPAREVKHEPPLRIAAALVTMKIESIHHQRAMRRAEQARKRTSQHVTRRR